jgi:hypothetical protein
VRVIIAGSRDITDYDLVKKAYFDSGFIATEIVSGGARGVDMLGERLAKELGIPCKRFPADWNKYGKSAGYKRNTEMVKYGEALLAITNGSKGTQHMIELSRKKLLPTYVVITVSNKNKLEWRKAKC